MTPARLATRLDGALDPAEEAEIAAFVKESPAASYLQRPDWPRLRPPPRRHRYVHLRCRHGGKLVAIALVRLTRLAPGRWLAAVRRGPVTGSLDDLVAALPALLAALRAHGACTAVLNPRWEDAAAGDAVRILRDAGGEVLPDGEQALHRATAYVDLEGDDAALLARFKGRARRQLRKAEAAGLKARPARSLDEAMLYAPILEGFHADRGLSLENVPDVATQWRLTREGGAFVLGWLDGRVVGGHTAIGDGRRAFWLTLAATDLGGDVPRNYPLLWEAMRCCRAQGFPLYDMAGIAPTDRRAADALGLPEAYRDQFKNAFAPVTVELTPAVVFALRRPDHDVLFALRRRWRRR